MIDKIFDYNKLNARTFYKGLQLKQISIQKIYSN